MSPFCRSVFSQPVLKLLMWQRRPSPAQSQNTEATRSYKSWTSLISDDKAKPAQQNILPLRPSGFSNLLTSNRRALIVTEVLIARKVFADPRSQENQRVQKVFSGFRSIFFKVMGLGRVKSFKFHWFGAKLGQEILAQLSSLVETGEEAIIAMFPLSLIKAEGGDFGMISIPIAQSIASNLESLLSGCWRSQACSLLAASSEIWKLKDEEMKQWSNMKWCETTGHFVFTAHPSALRLSMFEYSSCWAKLAFCCVAFKRISAVWSKAKDFPFSVSICVGYLPRFLEHDEGQRAWIW